MTDTEEALVLKARTGDRPAFEELVRRTSRLVYARLYLETGDGRVVEDLVQETYLHALRRIDRLQDPRTFRGWLLTIASNAAVDGARRAGRRKRLEPPRSDDSAAAMVVDGSPGPAEAAERREQQQKVLTVLKAMPEEYREPLMLRYLAGADYETIGAQLGLSNGSLRGLLHRGMKALRDALGEEPARTTGEAKAASGSPSAGR
jgi:RNA polymerase sigma-70 factor (ECF subfamily)